MVEGRVPPHPPGQLLACVKPQGQGCDRGTEDVAHNGHQAVGEQDRPEHRPRENDDGTQAQHCKCQHDGATFGAGLVDCSTDRRLDREPEQTGDRGHYADFGLAPMLLGDEEHVEIRPQRTADIGKQEVDGVER